MIIFDKGSVIRLSNEGTIGIVLGIAESQYYTIFKGS